MKTIIFILALLLFSSCSEKYILVYPALPNLKIVEECKDISLDYCKDKEDFQKCANEVLEDCKECNKFYEDEIKDYLKYKEVLESTSKEGF